MEQAEIIDTFETYQGSIVAFSISKSVEPNEEQKVMTSDLEQGVTAGTKR